MSDAATRQRERLVGAVSTDTKHLIRDLVGPQEQEIAETVTEALPGLVAAVQKERHTLTGRPRTREIPKNQPLQL